MSQAIRPEGSVPVGPKPRGRGGCGSVLRWIRFDGQCCHLGSVDHDPGWMDVSIEFGVDTESGAGGGGAGQVDGGWLVAGRACSWRSGQRTAVRSSFISWCSGAGGRRWCPAWFRRHGPRAGFSRHGSGNRWRRPAGTGPWGRSGGRPGRTSGGWSPRRTRPRCARCPPAPTPHGPRRRRRHRVWPCPGRVGDVVHTAPHRVPGVPPGHPTIGEQADEFPFLHFYADHRVPGGQVIGAWVGMFRALVVDGDEL